MWSQEKTALLVAYKAEGLSHRMISLKLGVTRNAVCGKVNRLGLSGKCKTPYRMRSGPDKEPRDSWDRMVFEPWSARKARLANKGVPARLVTGWDEGRAKA